MTLPYSFAAGQTAKSAEVNADFTFLNDRITTTASALQTSINAINNAISTITSTASYVPTGTVIWFSKELVPDGYLICNGAAVSRTDYSALFAVIGVKFGEGDGETTFNLPTLTDNRFIEGDTTIGTAKSAGLPNITGTTSCFQADYWRRSGGEATGAFRASLRAGGTDGNDDSDTCGQDTFNASWSNAIYGASDTVQPKSLTLLPCIKY